MFFYLWCLNNIKLFGEELGEINRIIPVATTHSQSETENEPAKSSHDIRLHFAPAELDVHYFILDLQIPYKRKRRMPNAFTNFICKKEEEKPQRTQPFNS